uniref:Prenyltransferase alpha-alpha toroid domain-containing protein n=1 Tax=Thermodesulfobacterium geofontis TaxID=1295609 RepID=A0A7V4JPF6_9BACT
MLSKININEVIAFVLKKEKSDGGFGATPLLPPTIEDTYYAVKILYLCNFSFNKNRLKDFLLHQKPLELSLKPLSKYFKLLNYLNLLNFLSPQIINICKNNLRKNLTKNLTNLEKLSFITEIFEILNEPDPILSIKTYVLNGLFSLNLKSLETYYYLYKILKTNFPSEFINIVLEAQNPDGGFGLLKDTTSYMEPTYYACYILYHFNLKPKNLTQLKDFILSCWTCDGGFGRNSQGISFLESTYQALWVLKKILKY